MPLLQLIYASRPFGYDQPTLNAILFDARQCNMRDGITGALICRDDLFLQLLEGPPAAVTAAFGRIRRDDRHVEVRELMRRMIDEDARMFGAWAMRDDPAATAIWTREEVAAGKPERSSPDEALAMFEWLATVPAA